MIAPGGIAERRIDGVTHGQIDDLVTAAGTSVSVAPTGTLLLLLLLLLRLLGSFTAGRLE